jgi:RNA polymerase sigma-70 factor (ECF subfamily)
MESDEHLHARIREGDLAAFDTLYARYEGPLFGFLVATLRDRPEAEDALHDVFLRALETPPAHLSGGGFRAWLFRVAKNHTLNRWRSRSRGAAATKNLEAAPRPATARDQLVRRVLHVALEGAVERLPETLAEVYRLRSSGLSYEEMAEVLETPLGTVKSRMHEMVKLLREDVEPWTAGE